MPLGATVSHIKIVVGTAVGIQFGTKNSPPALNCLEVQDFHNDRLILEVITRLGENSIRTIATDSIKGFVRTVGR